MRPIPVSTEPLSPEAADRWGIARDGLHLLVMQIVVAIVAGLVLLGVFLVTRETIPVAIAGGVLGLILVIMQLVGMWKLLYTPHRSAGARGWLIASMVWAMLYMASAGAVMGLTMMGMRGELPQSLIMTATIALQFFQVVASLAANLAFIFFLRQVGTHFANGSQVSICNQLLGMGAMLCAVFVAVAFLLGVNGFSPDRLARGLGFVEMLVVGGIGLLALVTYIWFVQALAGARDTITAAIDTRREGEAAPAAARFVGRYTRPHPYIDVF